VDPLNNSVAYFQPLLTVVLQSDL